MFGNSSYCLLAGCEALWKSGKLVNGALQAHCSAGVCIHALLHDLVLYCAHGTYDIKDLQTHDFQDSAQRNVEYLQYFYLIMLPQILILLFPDQFSLVNICVVWQGLLVTHWY